MKFKYFWTMFWSFFSGGSIMVSFFVFDINIFLSVFLFLSAIGEIALACIPLSIE